jgi:hypothetical protein
LHVAQLKVLGAVQLRTAKSAEEMFNRVQFPHRFRLDFFGPFCVKTKRGVNFLIILLAKPYDITSVQANMISLCTTGSNILILPTSNSESDDDVAGRIVLLSFCCVTHLYGNNSIQQNLLE